jgi:Icc-related predicted phosphoesterase
MKILVLGELNGELKMLDRIMQDVGLWKPDLVLFTGDMVRGEEREKLWKARQGGKALPAGRQDRIKAEIAADVDTYRRFLEEVGRFRGTVRIVPGHRDAPLSAFLRAALKDAAAGSQVGLVHQSFINVGRDFVLVGFGGDITEDERETEIVNCFPEWEVSNFLEILEHLPQDPILLTHYPPLAETIDLVDGVHVGSPSLREMIDRHRPAYVFCGHAHASQGIEAIGRTVVVNPGSLALGNYAIVNTRKETIRFNMLEE